MCLNVLKAQRADFESKLPPSYLPLAVLWQGAFQVSFHVIVLNMESLSAKPLAVLGAIVAPRGVRRDRLQLAFN